MKGEWSMEEMRKLNSKGQNTQRRPEYLIL
jgi:hypothetical protein